MTIKSLKNRSISAFIWGSAGSALKLLIQIGAQIFLARILGPEQYGLFAVGVIVISFSNFLSDIGLAYGLIQLPEVNDGHIRFVFTWQLILGVAVTGIVALLAGPLASFFSEPRAYNIILALAPLCFVQAATAVSLNLLKRNLDFKSLQIIQTSAYVLGYVGAGIPLAMAGWEVWALIYAWVIQVTATFILLYWRVRHATKPLLHHAEGHAMASFGLKVLVTNLTNWFIGNIDRVLIARYLPTAAVGLYATPYNLMYTPASTVMGVVQPVMYSACARVQGERERIGNAYLTLVAAIALFAIPVFLVISTVAETFILALYGSAWIEAGEVLRPIALAMPLLLLWNVTTPLFWTNGQSGLEFKMQIPLIVLWIVAILFAVQYSIAVVAWTVFGLYTIRTGVFIIAASRMVGITIGNYYRAVRGGILLGLIVASFAGGMDAWLSQMGQTASLRLLQLVLGCGVVLLICLKFFPQLISTRLAETIQQSARNMPRNVSRGITWFTGGVNHK